MVLSVFVQTGDTFDVKQFHARILDLGYAPLTMISEEIDEWIKAVKSETVNAAKVALSSSQKDKGDMTRKWLLLFIYSLLFLFTSLI